MHCLLRNTEMGSEDTFCLYATFSTSFHLISAFTVSVQWSCCLLSADRRQEYMNELMLTEHSEYTLWVCRVKGRHQVWRDSLNFQHTLCPDGLWPSFLYKVRRVNKNMTQVISMKHFIMDRKKKLMFRMTTRSQHSK